MKGREFVVQAAVRRRRAVLEERGIVLELRGQTAQVRLQRSSACSGCSAAGACRAGDGAGERVLTAGNAVGAVVGDVVRVRVRATSVLAAAAWRSLPPVAGLLAGAGAAQALAGWLAPGSADGRAAGYGGIAGVILGALAGRRIAGGATPRAIVTGILDDVDSAAHRR